MCLVGHKLLFVCVVPLLSFLILSILPFGQQHGGVERSANTHCVSSPIFLERASTGSVNPVCVCRYYPALRTLEQLEQTCLPRAGRYRFCSIMSDNIPRLRTLIRDTAMSQLKDFLESIRKHSEKIGETAMKQVCV
uniref:Exocyst complex component EXOC6/Sec15 N-terminal domain-containing protein n=1 Tax=Hucho hucho TaxID=62062 RepID=A0A4W5LX83_9TELE